MSRDSSGTYTAPTNSFNPAVEGTEINQDDFNEILTDVESALTDSLDRTGKGKVTAHIDFDENASPGTPAANVARLYAADSGGITKLYAKDSSGTVSDLTAGAGILAFKTIAVSGQSDVVAESSADTLTLVAGSNVTITTDASTDTVTISASGGGGGSGSPSEPQGRLTLSTGVPVMTSTVSGATTVYYTPYKGRYVPLYDGSSWAMTDIGGELSQATTDTTKSPAACTTNSNYDLFVWSDSGTYRCTRGPAWSSDTSRGTGAGTTELQMVAGILTNKNAITNGPDANRGAYVGTIRTNGSSQVDYIFGALAAGGTAGSIGVWNAYNRVIVSSLSRDSTDSWTYGTAGTWRAANNSSGMRCSMIVGLDEDAVESMYACLAGTSTTSSAHVGVGVNSTTAFSGSSSYAVYSASAAFASTIFGKWAGTVGAGWRYVSAIEAAQAGTITFYGDLGTPAVVQNGLTVTLRA